MCDLGHCHAPLCPPCKAASCLCICQERLFRRAADAYDDIGHIFGRGFTGFQRQPRRRAVGRFARPHLIVESAVLWVARKRILMLWPSSNFGVADLICKSDQLVAKLRR